MELTPRVVIVCVCVLVYAILLQFCVEFVMGWVALIFCMSIFFLYIYVGCIDFVCANRSELLFGVVGFFLCLCCVD